MRSYRPILPTLATIVLLLAACHGDDVTGPGPSGNGGAGGEQASASCGNGVCAGETCANCPQDCGPCPGICGDNSCDGAETCQSCPYDCLHTCSCGDGMCTNGYETCATCPADCGTCPPGCPDGVCDVPGGETCESCSPDCGACDEVCGDGTCGVSEECWSCAQDCGECSTCGNGVCELGEDCGNCEPDCGSCTWCGDGWCDWDEDCYSCSTDCGACDSCADGIIDGDETDIDCGGFSCPTCPDGWNCLEATDCTSNACIDDLCFPCSSAKLAWDAPTTYSDGTCLPITNLYGFTVYWGTTSGGPYPNTMPLTVAEAGCYETNTPDGFGCGNLWECTYTVSDLSNGLWYFSVSAVDINQVESTLPPEVSKTVDCP